MNWLVISLVGAAAVWFEFNYQRSRREKKGPDASSDTGAEAPSNPVPETAHVAEIDASPSISPGAENDKKLNITA